MKVIQKINLGGSDYSRIQMESGDYGWTIGNSAKYFLDVISLFEKEGYVIKFKTSFFQKIFGFSKYTIYAYKYK